MSNLMAGESTDRQWFALEFDNKMGRARRVGKLMAIGDCGDYETADEIATDLGYDTMWLVDPETAQDWADQLASRGIIGRMELAGQTDGDQRWE